MTVRCSPDGKPGLIPGASGRRLFFNVSHSGPLALFAFTRAGEVGIDVEVPRPRTPDLAPVAWRAFGAGEGRRLQTLPDHLREREFLRDWVRHEACLKRSGRRADAEQRAGGWRADRPGAASWLAELEPGGTQQRP